jgi:predicted nucleic acid-binding protein
MTSYLDANIFVLAGLAQDIRGTKTQHILKEIIQGKEKAITSSLTIDEVVWAFLKLTRDRELAIIQGMRIFQMNNIDVLDTTSFIIKRSLFFMQQYPSLKTRDSIHLATAVHHGASTFISDDKDFSCVKEIKWKKLS